MKIRHLGALLLALPSLATAVDLDWSGFATLGYAISDKPYRYQRVIDEEGSFARDSVLGGQLDIRLSPRLSATLQARLAPSTDSDSGWDPTLSWAFLAWRPADDLMLRLGKLRVPYMLDTENHDVGVTYPFARLPAEVYATTPTSDIYGLMLSLSNWNALGEWTVDGYYGRIGSHQRIYLRSATGQPEQRASYNPTRMQGGGVVFSLRHDEDLYRLGLHSIRTERRSGTIIADFPFSPLPVPPYQPGEGFYDLSNPPQTNSSITRMLTLGASIDLPAAFRFSAEYVRLLNSRAVNGWNRWAAYAALSRRVGEWTPYLYLARMQSGSQVLNLYDAVMDNQLSVAFSPVDDSQRAVADMLLAHDQGTLALGTSCRLGSNTLLKAEWAQTRTWRVSGFVDPAPGNDSADLRINVLSLSWSVTF
jgi:hypothetical protein